MISFFGACAGASTCTKNGSRIVKHNNCHEYYECVDGRSVLNTCSDNMYFNCWENKCEVAVTFGCYPTGMYPICYKELIGEKIPNLMSNDCALYLECAEIRSVFKSCDAGQKFDQWKKACVPEKEASCAQPSRKCCEHYPSDNCLPTSKFSVIYVP